MVISEAVAETTVENIQSNAVSTFASIKFNMQNRGN